ncbi:hypothetical protein ACW9ID_21455 [Pseudomonas gingeri]
MKESTDTPKPVTTDQVLERKASRAEINAKAILKIGPILNRLFYLYSSPALRDQVFATNDSPPPPLSLWTFQRANEGEKEEVWYIQSYPDNNLCLTYDASVGTVRLKPYSGNDDQKWLVLNVEPTGEDTGVYFICNIVKGSSYIRIREPLYNNTAITTDVNHTGDIERFTLYLTGLTP